MDTATAKQLERRLVVHGLLTNIVAGAFIALFSVIAFGFQRLHVSTFIGPIFIIFVLGTGGFIWNIKNLTRQLSGNAQGEAGPPESLKSIDTIGIAAAFPYTAARLSLGLWVMAIAIVFIWMSFTDLYPFSMELGMA